ncbi:hypothetical protein UFOVP1367_29 [uncultured Caudovirales phage]|uniref:Uncharacterized protein n=1 Tax=uncultured Caudovirales phage TaxID=2100421 RepID=A0A6J5S3N2_9CAUD|nr:hypothetical protein KNT69_gp29 [uncultured Caudovirales phage]CAB4202649.1 hypothetical protein UFOVP1367_29 [uncultured Caudovirales phage]
MNDDLKTAFFKVLMVWIKSCPVDYWQHLLPVLTQDLYFRFFKQMLADLEMDADLAVGLVVEFEAYFCNFETMRKNSSVAYFKAANHDWRLRKDEYKETREYQQYMSAMNEL